MSSREEHNILSEQKQNQRFFIKEKTIILDIALCEQNQQILVNGEAISVLSFIKLRQGLPLIISTYQDSHDLLQVSRSKRSLVRLQGCHVRAMVMLFFFSHFWGNQFWKNCHSIIMPVLGSLLTFALTSIKGRCKKNVFFWKLFPIVWNHPPTPGFLWDLGKRKVKFG